MKVRRRSPPAADPAPVVITPELAESTAVRDRDDGDGATWKVPGCDGTLPAQPITAAHVRAELAPIAVALRALLDRWLATLEVCLDGDRGGGLGDDGASLFRVLEDAVGAVDRALQSDASLAAEVRCAVAGLALEHGEQLAAILAVRNRSATGLRTDDDFARVVLTLAYGLEVQATPAGDIADAPCTFFAAAREGG